MLVSMHWNNTKELLDTMVLVRVQYSPRVGGNEVGCHTIVSRVGINVLRNGVMVKHVQLVCTEVIGEWEVKSIHYRQSQEGDFRNSNILSILESSSGCENAGVSLRNLVGLVEFLRLP